ncbi:(d)CMP kinase [Alphaproteobacteria bacterium]|nr:(d)CMP kinase [Alphaproteobacteria bacterium]
MNKSVITVDGPAASGKGSLSKKISEEFNFFYMETGIYYRGFASLFYQNQVNILDLPAFISNLNINDFEEYIIHNKKKLYSTKVTKLASNLAKNKEIRSFIIKIQQEMIIALGKKFNGIILEGRDCGSVVAPKADLKFYLTASLKVRAERRFNQLTKDNKDISYEQVLSDLRERDIQDKNRKHSPLQKPKGAVVIDNSDYKFEQTINIVKNIIFSRIPTLKNKI